MACSVFASSITEHEAKTLFKQQRWPEAYAAYMSLLRKFPDNGEIQLGLARSAVSAGQHTRALIFYEQLVQRYPENTTLWQELAKVYTALGNHESAGAALNKKLKPGGLIPLSTEKQDLLKVNGRISTGIIHDSNISLAPSDYLIPIGNTNLVLDNENMARESWGAYVLAAIHLNRRIHAASPWWLIADFGAYQKWYFDENAAMTWGRAAAGLHYALNDISWMLRIKGEQSLFDYDGMATSLGAEGNFSYRFLPKTYLITKAEYGLRDYPDSSDHSDTYGWIGEYLRMLFSNDKCELILGGRWIANTADNSKYSAQGWETSGQLRFLLPFDSDIGLLAAFETKSYDEPAFIWVFNSRKDRKIRLGINLTHHLTDCFSINLNFQRLENDSNTELYDYDQNIISTGVTWTF
jgi:tetratricopeptide (TPR) repeat protein